MTPIHRRPGPLRRIDSIDRPDRALGSRAAGGLLTLVILELTAATALIHLSLGGPLFQLNAVGYLVLGAAYAIGAWAPIPLVERFSWLPRAALGAYALVTIGAYLVMGPWFLLGWVTKGIELAIAGLLLVDLVRVHAGSVLPGGTTSTSRSPSA